MTVLTTSLCFKTSILKRAKWDEMIIVLFGIWFFLLPLDSILDVTQFNRWHKYKLLNGNKVIFFFSIILLQLISFPNKYFLESRWIINCINMHMSYISLSLLAWFDHSKRFCILNHYNYHHKFIGRNISFKIYLN